jgi:hypothetical protein
MLALGGHAPGASAVDITFSRTDLVDATPGEDLWRYDYMLDAFPFATGHGFSVLFDPALYASLESPPPAVSDQWDAISLQPDTGLPDPGRYDAQALVDEPTFLGIFSVSFVFRGTGAPGAQPFEIYDPEFQLIQTGVTVPEPSTFLLIASGLLVLLLRREARRPT